MHWGSGSIPLVAFVAADDDCGNLFKLLVSTILTVDVTKGLISILHLILKEALSLPDKNKRLKRTESLRFRAGIPKQDSSAVSSDSKNNHAKTLRANASQSKKIPLKLF
ncbi:hypothetical protein CDAR_462931 [Caerostris darwini]|uniref:Uncharacterized protein n=1 Tax=Caerostris darwini TaxID=1538125 RepID=A0AAV4Q611_9ARAC|nr:hypothetical protein CDAR_462931 [Caerostris darwini]